MQSRSDGELVAACIKGDQQAGEELMNRAYRPVWQATCRYIRSNCKFLYDDARDIVQAAFINTYEKMYRYDQEKGEFAAWVLGFAKNICLKKAKEKERELPFDFTDELERQLINNGKVNHLQKGTIYESFASSYERFYFYARTSFRDQPDEFLVKQEHNGHLINALGQLDEHHRNIIFDRIVLEKPYKQIASEYNCSVDKVTSLFWRAIAKYKEIFLKIKKNHDRF